MKNALRMLLGLVIVGMMWTTAVRAAEHTKDTPAEIKKAVKKGDAVLIDVREEAEWDAGHLKDAKLLPLSALEEIKAADLAKKVPKEKIVYCHCAAGRRALVAGEVFKKYGYDVRPLKSGYRDLLKSGFEQASK